MGTPEQPATDTLAVVASIVLPVFNEADNLARVVLRVESELDRLKCAHEIILVDDGSTDRTWHEIEVADREFVGTLLVQLHIVAEIALAHPILYSNHPTAVAMQTFRADHAEFGSAEAEAGRFEVGSITANNSVNFSRGFIEIAREIELRHEVPFLRSSTRLEEPPNCERTTMTPRHQGSAD